MATLDYSKTINIVINVIMPDGNVNVDLFTDKKPNVRYTTVGEIKDDKLYITAQNHGLKDGELFAKIGDTIIDTGYKLGLTGDTISYTMLSEDIFDSLTPSQLKIIQAPALEAAEACNEITAKAETQEAERVKAEEERQAKFQSIMDDLQNFADETLNEIEGAFNDEVEASKSATADAISAAVNASTQATYAKALGDYVKALMGDLESVKASAITASNTALTASEYATTQANNAKEYIDQIGGSLEAINDLLKALNS